MAQLKCSNNNATLSLLNINNIGMDIDRFFFFFRKFQFMSSAPDDSSLSSDQDTNQFLI